MEVVVNNTFGNTFIDLFKNLITSLVNFWDLINKTWFTIPLSKISDILQDLGIDFVLEDLPINFVYLITTGLVVVIIIHIIKLIIS